MSVCLSAAHDDPQRPRPGGDGTVLPDGAGYRTVGLEEVQGVRERQQSRPERDHAVGQQRDQSGGGSLHHDRLACSV